MKICVFGASGKTGHQIVNLAVQQQHEVIAVARNAGSVGQLSPLITPVAADVLSPESLSFLTDYQDIDHIIIALGSKALRGDPVRSRGTQNIVEALKQAGIKPRVSLISAAGTHESWSQLDWISKAFAKILLPAVMREHEEQEQHLIDSGLPFTIFRASGLVDKKPNDRFQIITEGKMKPATIERFALANCIVGGLSSDEWLNQKLTVTGRP